MILQLLALILNFIFPVRKAPPYIPPVPEPEAPPKMMTSSEKLYLIAKTNLDTRLTLDESIPAAVGCAQAVSKALKTLSNTLIPPGGISGTYTLLEWLKTHPTLFREVSEAAPGRIIISPTGYSTKRFPHGHVGICLTDRIASNNSFNGLWQDKFTHKMWDDYYRRDRGFPVRYFEVL